MANPGIANFTVLDSIYGKFIINRHCTFQAEHLVKTGVPHIQPELNNILAIANTLSEQCVVVDAGANAGLVAIPIAQVIKERGGKVHAFEVQRMLYNALCGSVALNDLSNVHVYRQGLGAQRGSFDLTVPDYSTPQDFGLFSLVPNAPPRLMPDAKAAKETVEVIPLDDMKLPRLDFLKIDVEGMELEVLKGAETVIREHLPWCWIEYGTTKIEDIKRCFQGLPYQFYVMDQLNVLGCPAPRSTAAKLTINANPA